ncbi:MAG: aldose 1-epimerase, partial [Candidatus Ratteibacteria bacterium]
EKLKIGFFMEFPIEVFKYIWLWRIAKGSYNYPWYGRNYNLALEPFSSLPVLSKAIKRNDQLKLKENSSLKIKLKAGIRKI